MGLNRLFPPAMTKRLADTEGPVTEAALAWPFSQLSSSQNVRRRFYCRAHRPERRRR